MNDNHRKKKLKGKFGYALKRFSAGMFKNVRIMRARYHISSLTRLKNQKFKELGMKTFRLIKTNRIEIPETEKTTKELRELEEKINQRVEEINSIILDDNYPERNLLSSEKEEAIRKEESRPASTDVSVDPDAELTE